MREREEHVLLVRHVPRQLRDDQIESLFANFGSTGVRILNSKQKKTASVFVSFRSRPEAQCAITRLHQMDVMGYRLSAELSNKSLPVYEPPGRCDSIKDKETQYLTLLKQLHLNKCPPSGPKYIYPSPTLHVLLNILSALYEHKRFYTQVLHLMNKMNLPCPFNMDYVRDDKINHLFSCGQKLWTPEFMQQNIEDVDIAEFLKNHPPLVEQTEKDTLLQDVPMQAASDTEEEIESEMEDSDKDDKREDSHSAAILNLKRVRERKSRVGIKRPRFIKPMLASGVKADDATKKKSDNVFEASVLCRKPIQMKVSSDLSSITDQPTPDQALEDHSRPTIIPSVQTQTSLTSSSQIKASPSETDLISGHINRESKSSGISQKTKVSKEISQDSSVHDTELAQDVASTEQTCKAFSVISKEQLDSNRLGERDRSFVKAFTHYSPGIPSCRLYVKNLAKNVTQEDMEFIFRRYHLPDYKEQGTMFDIRLMQEGRMKGQAFITLQTDTQARQALTETNGFILKDKPMVVQYARSIQAKPASLI